MLDKRGIKHEVLNAKHHQREAEIVAQAGRKGAVTIATNMAGRGTDIILGGNPETHGLGPAAGQISPRGSTCPQDEWDALVNEIEQREKMKAEGPRGGRAWAACTSSAPSGTRPAASTSSFAAVAAGRAIPAAAASTCRWKTT